MVDIDSFVREIEKDNLTDVDEALVYRIVKYCGIALSQPSSTNIDLNDTEQINRIRDGFCIKELKLSPEDAQEAIEKALAHTNRNRLKSRLAFYYLLAEYAIQLDKEKGHIRPEIVEAFEGSVKRFPKTYKKLAE